MLLAAVGGAVEIVAPRSNTKSNINIKVAKLQVFDRTAGKVLEFLTVCKLFISIRMRMRDDSVKEQIQ